MLSLAATSPQLCLNQQGMLGEKVAIWSMQHSDHFVQFHKNRAERPCSKDIKCDYDNRGLLMKQ